jgi:hypothetical protein
MSEDGAMRFAYCALRAIDAPLRKSRLVSLRKDFFSMTLLNMLLTVVLAIATVAQAALLWLERRTPLENAIYDKQISATVQAAEAISEKCRLRFVPDKDAKKRQEDWVNMMMKRRQAQLTLMLVANKELLTMLSDVYEKEDVFDGEKYWNDENVAVKESFGKAFGKGTLIFWKCDEIAHDFLENARNVSGLDLLSEEMRDKLSRMRPSDVPSQPIAGKEQ